MTAFFKLRTRVEQKQRLLLQDLSKDFYLFVDASQYVTGMVLCLKMDKGKLGIGAYSSKKLRKLIPILNMSCLHWCLDWKNIRKY